MKTWWLLIPVFLALAGWILARIMVSRLFRMAQSGTATVNSSSNNFFKNNPELTGNIASLVANDLFAFKEIEQALLSPSHFQKIIPELEVHIDHFLSVRLKEKMPMVGMFVGERTIKQMKDIFMEEMETLFPVIMKSYLQGLTKDMNLESQVSNKLNAIPAQKISALLGDYARKQQNSVAFVGAIFGLILGIIQVIILLFLNK